MVNGNCAEVSCQNSQYRLKKWKKQSCKEHADCLHEECTCRPPFSLHRFPSKLLNAASRQEWTRLMNRTTKSKTAWIPGESDMVCSVHFLDGKPTAANPNPTVDLGYEKPSKKPRRALIRQPLYLPEEISDSEELCHACQEKDTAIAALTEKLTCLSIGEVKLQKQVHDLSKQVNVSVVKVKPFSCTNIQSDSKMRFYTGIQTIAIFNTLFSWIKPCLSFIFFGEGETGLFFPNITEQERKRLEVKISSFSC